MTKREVLRGGTDTLSLDLSDHGRAVVPTACSARILENGTVLQSGAAIGGVFTPSGSVVSQVKQNLVIEWTYTYAGNTNKISYLFDVVISKLYPVVNEADLIREAPSLINAVNLYYGSVLTAGTVASIVDPGLIGSRQDLVGAVIKITTGAQSGKQYVVSTFSPITGTLTTDGSDAIAANDAYLLIRSFQGELDMAWEDVYDMLVQACAGSAAKRDNGLNSIEHSRVNLILTPERLRRAHTARALEKVFRGLADDPAGIDWTRAEYYKAEFEAAMNNLQLVFAAAEDTVNTTVDKDSSLQQGWRR